MSLTSSVPLSFTFLLCHSLDPTLWPSISKILTHLNNCLLPTMQQKHCRPQSPLPENSTRHSLNICGISEWMTEWHHKPSAPTDLFFPLSLFLANIAAIHPITQTKKPGFILDNFLHFSPTIKSPKKYVHILPSELFLKSNSPNCLWVPARVEGFLFAQHDYQPPWFQSLDPIEPFHFTTFISLKPNLDPITSLLNNPSKTSHCLKIKCELLQELVLFSSPVSSPTISCLLLINTEHIVSLPYLVTTLGALLRLKCPLRMLRQAVW